MTGAAPIIARVSTAAQATSRIATNSSGERCRNPTFPVMNEELQSMTNSNGANRASIVDPVAAGFTAALRMLLPSLCGS